MLSNLQKQRPVVLCLTNSVVMNFTANVLLASGAIPIMSFDESDSKDLVNISSAILINIGTLDDKFIAMARIVLECGIKNGLPIVFDPVGSGASHIRTEISKEFASNKYEKLVIKGNAAEFLSLDKKIESKGVESTYNSKSAIDIAKKLEKLCCITGEEDYIVFNNKVMQGKNGSPKMQKVTGMGCSLGAVMAAFLAVEFSPHSIGSALSYFNIAGELASKDCFGIGDFAVKFLDNLYNLKQDEVEKRTKIYEL